MLVTGVITGCALGDRPVESPSPVLSSQFRLTSPVFADESLIPAKFTCDGENISPMLQWDQPPTQTKSLALIVEDPDAPGQTFTHWVLYDLPPDTRQLPEKVSPQPFLQAGGLQGKSSFGKYGYGGPCPPSGTHRYLFKLYALDQILDLPPGTTQTDLVEAMQGHVLAEAKLTGKYARP
ncbi:MAG: YbhB/YbcL family Raf kinase inhibitor-like protein [Oscillatoriophycideae cyanobacterium NC_groundwater_1537_Pr4_S-0.65um_50_18]|nr:YbhB/YbcL family Raf kinase inhibitor-like protein [Oscillatoriophycideae cyanobacterium NC_groundwater_1537_Pr4_S-0.65um_50_18]